MQCKAISRETGLRCKGYALIGEEVCFFHSKSEKAMEGRKRARIPRTRDMLRELSRQLIKIKKCNASPLEKSREIRAILAQIEDLKRKQELAAQKEEKTEEPEKSGEDGTLKDKLEEWEKESK